MAMHMSSRWQDRVILLLGLWLFAAPFILGYPSESKQAVNSYTAGLVIALLAVFDLYKTYMWAVVVNMLVGLWVAVSPWVPAFADRSALMTNHVIVGVAVLVLALWELRSDPALHKQWAITSTG
jgi:succinate dehydrogenase/fumarate reductase cytochrome b subunit